MFCVLAGSTCTGYCYTWSGLVCGELWLYAVAATFTDAHKCADPAAKEAYLDTLRGPDFAAVKGIIRDLPDDRLTAMRDTAIRLEGALSPDRTDDSMCGAASGRLEIRQDAEWQRELAPTRAMLPRHLAAICSLLRPKRTGRP